MPPDLHRPHRYEREWEKYTDVHELDTCAAARRPGPNSESAVHVDQQDHESEGRVRLIDFIDEAAADGRETFAPRHHMPPGVWAQVMLLPPSIA